MLVEYEPSQFGRTRPLWGVMGSHLAVESILRGKTTARIFVDDASEPHTAMTWIGNRLYITRHRRLWLSRDIKRGVYRHR